MLRITLVNLRGTQEVADYSYQVTVNGEVIARGTVLRHFRAKGWEALVRRMLRAAKAQKASVR